MAKVEQKVQQLQRHIDGQFDALHQSLQLRQEQLIAHAMQSGLPNRRKVNDTSV